MPAFPTVTGGVPQRGIPKKPNSLSHIALDASGQQVEIDTTERMGLTSGFMRALDPPPLTPGRWIVDQHQVFDYTQVGIGQRIELQHVVQLNTGLFAILYNADKEGSPSDELGQGGTGGNYLHPHIAFSSNMLDWSQGYAILSKSPTSPQSAWEGTRQRGSAIIYDPTNEEWVLWYDGNGNPGDGSGRQWGYATSPSLRDGFWTKYANNPVVTSKHPDIVTWAPGTQDATYITGGAVILVNGTWYAITTAGQRSGSIYKVGILKSTDKINWTGGAHNPIFEPTAGNWEDGFILPKHPIWCDSTQRWYIPYYNRVGQLGIAVSESNPDMEAALLSSYTKYGPVVTFEGADNSHPMLVPLSGGGWACFYSVNKDNPTLTNGAIKSLVRVALTDFRASDISSPISRLSTSLSQRLVAANNLTDLDNTYSAIQNLLSSDEARRVLMGALIPHLQVDPTAGNIDSREMYLYTDSLGDITGSLQLRVGPVKAPTIVGNAFPGETVNCPEGLGEWKIDGATVTGYTSSLTYQVKFSDVGKGLTVTIGANTSAATTIWKPSDITQVAAWYVAYKGALVSTGPEVEAANTADVLQWNDQSGSGHHITQSTSAQRPRRLVDAHDGLIGDRISVLDFNPTTNDAMEIPASLFDLFRNVAHGYIFAAVEDTNPGAGDSSHYVCGFATGTGGVRLALCTRTNGDNFGVFHRVEDANSLNTAEVVQERGRNVLVAHGDCAGKTTRFRVNAFERKADAAPTTGTAFSNTASTKAYLGGDNTVNNGEIKIAALVIAAGNTKLTATEISQIEKWLGIAAGKQLELV